MAMPFWSRCRAPLKRDDVANLKTDFGKLLANRQAEAGDLKQLEEKLTQLDAKLGKMQKATGSPAKK
jgi:hypothetical protein